MPKIIARMATQLIQLQDVERLSASVIRVLGGNPGKVGSSVLDIAFQQSFYFKKEPWAVQMVS